MCYERLKQSFTNLFGYTRPSISYLNVNQAARPLIDNLPPSHCIARLAFSNKFTNTC